MAKISESKLLKWIEEKFWVTAEYIEWLLKVIKDASWDTSKLVLTEQFNLWYIEWMKDSARQLEQYFIENVKQPVQDFKEIDPTANVENINQETNEDWNNETCTWADVNEEKDHLNKS